jgi:MoxR-like ATPase
LTIDQVLRIREGVSQVFIEKDVLEYATQIVRKTSESPRVAAGASVRAGIQLLACARALACVRGREFVTPKEILDLAIPVLSHRLLFVEEGLVTEESQALIKEVTDSVPAPV